MKIKQDTLNNQWITQEIIREVRNYLEINENRNTTFQNLQGTMKTVLKGKINSLKEKKP